ncbi:MAG: hypothetical protein HY882_16755 [Deltaproteobacteria bacterium]|nr:hypothetical protein [Deltaproteobacteria bacterium]
MKKRRRYETTEVPEKSSVFSKRFSLKGITERIISCALEVHCTLGSELLEGVYEEALAHDFTLKFSVASVVRF